MNCIGYVRVSTEKQAGEVQTSLADQEAAIREHAERLGLAVAEWFRDEGASGATVGKRPGFRKLLAYCEANPRKGGDGTVLVLNDSRFGRFPDPEEAAYWRHHLRRLGWIVRFAEGDDTENPIARTVLRAIGSAQATEYRENIRRNARRGKRGAALQGFWTCRAPFGYRRQVVHGGAPRILEEGQRKAPSEKVKLAPHPHEAELVRWIFEQYASGTVSLEQLARELDKRRPDRKWSKTVVNHLLRNPAYVGDVVGGKRTASGETPEEYVCRSAHPAIVSRELFAVVQERLARNKSRGGKHRVNYLLSGLLRCTHCGGHYRGGGSSALQRRGKRGVFRFYGEARDRLGVVDCPGRVGTVSRHLVDDAVIEAISELVSGPQARRRIEQALDAQIGSERQTLDPAVLRAERQRLLKKRDRLVAAVADGTVRREEAATTLEHLRREIEAVEAKEQTTRFEQRRDDLEQEDRERLIRAALDFPTVIRHLPGPAQRAVVEPWIESAAFDKVTRVLDLSLYPLPLRASGLPGPD